MEFIQYEVNGSVAEIILNRPDAHHALNEQMLSELKEAVEKAAASESSERNRERFFGRRRYPDDDIRA